ncbi:MAG: hypothetical protein ACI8UZ_002197 [Akkermansiaceae bacterium]|jgi:hypothetical protein
MKPTSIMFPRPSLSNHLRPGAKTSSSVNPCQRPTPSAVPAWPTSAPGHTNWNHSDSSRHPGSSASPPNSQRSVPSKIPLTMSGAAPKPASFVIISKKASPHWGGRSFHRSQISSSANSPLTARLPRNSFSPAESRTSFFEILAIWAKAFANERSASPSKTPQPMRES